MRPISVESEIIYSNEKDDINNDINLIEQAIFLEIKQILMGLYLLLLIVISKIINKI